MTIIEAKIVIAIVLKVLLLKSHFNVKMHNFLFTFLRYRDSNQIMIFKDCNRIKGSFD